MKSIKLTFKMMLCIIVLFTLLSCSKDTSKTNSNEKQDYELTINTYDAAGNQISQTFSKIPTRVICNNLSSAKTMIDLGLEDLIIGMPNTDNEVVGEYKEKIDKITKLGDKKTLSKEVIISYEPDIIIGRAAMFTSSLMGTYDELNKYGINIFTQSSSIANTEITSVANDIRTLGKIFNVESRAEEVAEDIENKIVNAIKDIEITDSYKNALIMCNFNGTTFGAYKSALQEKMLNLLGYTNVASSTSGLTLENLVNMNPKLIIYVTSDRNQANDKNAINLLKNIDIISDVEAIKSDFIITIAYDDFMEYGSNIIDSLVLISNFLKQ
ncbi:MAG: ABC transporter substrate-binding protein [Anaeroplasma sp.]